MDREAEIRRLAFADAHIAKAETAVSKQMIEVERLRRDGHETAVAQRTLKAFQDTLEAMRLHRDEIVRTIARIDQRLI